MLMEAMFEQAQWFAQMWTDFAVKMAQAGAKTDPMAPPPEAAREARTAMFHAMSQTAEQYMRMPQFLQMMKQSMDFATAYRKQLNDFLTAMHHNAQGIAKQDIDQLMLSVRHLESRMLECTEQTCARLDEMSRRVSALEGRGGGAGPAAASRSPVSVSVSPTPSAPAAENEAGEENAGRGGKRPARRPREEGAKS